FYRAGSAIAALDGVTLDLRPGEVTAVIGPSGCGKTTLLQILGLIDGEYEGELRFENHDVRALAAQARAQLRLGKIGFVFQNFQLIDALTITENVALPHWRLNGNRRAAEDRARELLRT